MYLTYSYDMTRTFIVIALAMLMPMYVASYSAVGSINGQCDMPTVRVSSSYGVTPTVSFAESFCDSEALCSGYSLKSDAVSFAFASGQTKQFEPSVAAAWVAEYPSASSLQVTAFTGGNDYAQVVANGSPQTSEDGEYLTPCFVKDNYYDAASLTTGAGKCPYYSSCNYDPFFSKSAGDGDCDNNCCNDASACNIGALDDCEYTSCQLCTSSSACNFGQVGNCDYDSCCTDINACNFRGSGACDYNSCCTVHYACNFGSTGSCDYDSCCANPNSCGNPSDSVCDFSCHDGDLLQPYEGAGYTKYMYRVCSDGTVPTVESVIDQQTLDTLNEGQEDYLRHLCDTTAGCTGFTFQNINGAYSALHFSTHAAASTFHASLGGGALLGNTDGATYGITPLSGSGERVHADCYVRGSVSTGAAPTYLPQLGSGECASYVFVSDYSSSNRNPQYMVTPPDIRMTAAEFASEYSTQTRSQVCSSLTGCLGFLDDASQVSLYFSTLAQAQAAIAQEGGSWANHNTQDVVDYLTTGQSGGSGRCIALNPKAQTDATIDGYISSNQVASLPIASTYTSIPGSTNGRAGAANTANGFASLLVQDYDGNANLTKAQEICDSFPECMGFQRDGNSALRFYFTSTSAARCANSGPSCSGASTLWSMYNFDDVQEEAGAPYVSGDVSIAANNQQAGPYPVQMKPAYNVVAFDNTATILPGAPQVIDAAGYSAIPSDDGFRGNVNLHHIIVNGNGNGVSAAAIAAQCTSTASCMGFQASYDNPSDVSVKLYFASQADAEAAVSGFTPPYSSYYSGGSDYSGGAIAYDGVDNGVQFAAQFKDSYTLTPLNPANPGCTDPSAANYDPSASTNTGCVYAQSGPVCENDGACNAWSPGACDFSCHVYGCMNPDACNYDSSATRDSGLCDLTCAGPQTISAASGTTLVGSDLSGVSGDVVIAEGTTGITLTGVDLSAITSIQIPASVTNIAAASFSDYAGTITFAPRDSSASLTVGTAAFVRAPGITTFNLPGVLIIDQVAFGDSGLTSLDLSAATSVTLNGGNHFQGTASLSNVDLGSVTAISNSMFKNSGLTSISIPSSVSSIGTEAFSGASALASVSIADGASSLGDYAFANTAITSIDIPTSVTTIGAWAFDGAPLQTINFANSASSVTIGSDALPSGASVIYTNPPLSPASGGTIVGSDLSGASGDIVIAEGTTGISLNGVDLSAITSIQIPASVTNIDATSFAAYSGAITFAPRDSSTSLNIGTGAFAGASGITTFDLPGALTIDQSAFAGSGLTSLDLSAASSVTLNGGSHFQDTASLSNVDLGSVTAISDSMFANSGLTSVTIPASVSSIGTSAFSGASSLASASLPEGLQTVADSAFADTALTSVVIPSSVTSVGANAFANAPLSSAVIAHKDSAAITVDSTAFPITAVFDSSAAGGGQTVTSLADLDGKTGVITLSGVTDIPAGLAATYDLSGITKIIFSSDVATIGDNAFANTAMDIDFAARTASDSLSIGANAFSNSGAVSLTLPAGSVTIGNSAFSGSSLQNIDLSGASSVTLSGSSQFADTASLTGADLGPITTVTDNMFANTALTAVQIPATVTNVGVGAFSGSSVTTVIASPTTTFDNTSLPSGVTPLLVTVIAPAAGETQLNMAQLDGLTGLIEIAEGTEGFSNDWGTYDFSGITGVSLPTTLTSVNNGALQQLHAPISFAAGRDANSQLTFDDWCCNGYQGTSLTLPPGQVTFRNNAFNNAALQSVDLSAADSVTLLQGVFEDNAALASVDLGNTVSIGEAAFKGTALTSVTIPATVTDIGVNAFADNANLATINIDHVNANSINIDASALPVTPNYVGGTSIAATTVTAADLDGATGPIVLTDATSIAADLASGADLSGITAIYLPPTLTSIGSNAFSGFQGQILFSDGRDASSTLDIGAGAFQNSAQTSLDLPAGDVTIGDSAFAGSALTSVDFGNANSVTLSGGSQFSGASSLDTINLAGATSVSDNMLAGTSVSSIIIPASVTSVGANALPSSVTSVTVAHADSSSVSIDASAIPSGVTPVYDANAIFSTVVAPDAGSDTVNMAQLDGLTGVISIAEGTIGFSNDWASYDFSGITKLILPASLEQVNNGALQQLHVPIEFAPGRDASSQLTFDSYCCNNYQGSSLTLPRGQVTFNNQAFPDSGLQSVDMSQADSVSIGNDAFDGASQLASVNLGNTVSIGESAFRNTALDSVIIPSTTTSVGANAFGGTTPLSGGVTIAHTDSSTITVDPSSFNGVTPTYDANASTGGGSGGGSSNPFCDSYTCNVGSKKADDHTIECVMGYCDDDQCCDAPSGGGSSGTVVSPASGSNVDMSQLDGLTGVVTIAEGTTGFSNDWNTYDFSGITKIVLPVSLTSIDNGAFQNLHAPIEFAPGRDANSQLDIGSSAFYQNQATSFTAPPGQLTIGNNAFGGAAIHSLDLSAASSVTIGSSAFENTQLSSVDLGSTTTIGDAAFQNTGLDTVVIPSTTTSVGANAFAGAPLSGGVTIAHADSSTITVDPSSFNGVTPTYDANASTGGGGGSGGSSNPFCDSYTCNVGSKKADDHTIECVMGYCDDDQCCDAPSGGGSSGTVVSPASGSNVDMSQLDGLTGVVTIAEGTTGFSNDWNTYNFTGITKIVLPVSLTSIDNGAFQNLHAPIEFAPGRDANSQLDIGSSAFYQNQATSFTAPPGQLTFGNNAFGGAAIQSLDLSAASSVTIGASAFENTQLSSVDLGSTTTIGDAAFQNTGLDTVVIPSTTTSVGANAFAGAPLSGGVTIAHTDSSTITVDPSSFNGVTPTYDANASTGGGSGGGSSNPFCDSYTCSAGSKKADDHTIECVMGYCDDDQCCDAPPACPKDLTGDGKVNAGDLSVVLGDFGDCASGDCPKDLTGDGKVNAGDLSVILGDFGDC